MKRRGTMAAAPTLVSAARAMSGPAMHRRRCAAGTARAASWRNGCRLRSPLESMLRELRACLGLMIDRQAGALPHQLGAAIWPAGTDADFARRIITQAANAISVRLRIVRGFLHAGGTSRILCHRHSRNDRCRHGADKRGQVCRILHGSIPCSERGDRGAASPGAMREACQLTNTPPLLVITRRFRVWR